MSTRPPGLIDAPRIGDSETTSTSPAETGLPDPADGGYTDLVWDLARALTGQVPAVSADTAAAPAVDAWVSRYLECAGRLLTGRPLTQARAEWLSAQRAAHSRGELPAGRAALLERLPGFTWLPDTDRWGSNYRSVFYFAAAHGRIPTRRDDQSLAGWLAGQRFALRSGRLSQERIAALAVLPGWRESLSTPRARDQWERRRGEVASFLETGDGCYPDPRSEDPAEAELGQWVSWQRKCHRRRDLSASRAAVLEELPNWRWSEREARFDWKVCELREALKEGPVLPGHRLYSWVRDQRSRHREGRLADWQTAALEALGVLTPPRRARTVA